ncbi:putative ATP-dependent helicase [Listeria grayi FSL F6-1183]|uniref:Putative ATP-dependent helicase n=1 Tax=Listeria grayi FSL F6-1183 TaxID=1265827 RepID=A0A829R5W3_LISGR|nr:putative ATP-dependent helicase [Listeria grayi FSL F6-1183]
MYISLEKQMIPYSIKQKGRALFKENAMTAFRVPEDSSIYKTMFTDHETVKDDNNGNYHCSCQTFSEKQYCEHVYAVSLQIEEENQQKNKINFKKPYFTARSRDTFIFISRKSIRTL